MKLFYLCELLWPNLLLFTSLKGISIFSFVVSHNLLLLEGERSKILVKQTARIELRYLGT